MNDALLEVQNLTKVYAGKEGKPDLTVLDDVDFSLTEGESVAVIGASGSGKSTLLHLMGGLDRPTSGKVLYRGRELNRLTDSELASFRNRNLGFVFQFHHLLPEFTALENVFLPGLINKRPTEELTRRAYELLDRLGVKERASHRPTELSGGEQQRVAIARALINNPDLLLADEPTGNLDENSTASLLELLMEIHSEQNLTLVLVTHDRKVAAQCGRIAELHQGKLIKQDETA